MLKLGSSQVCAGNGLGHYDDDDDDGGLNSVDSRISFAAPVSGTYDLKVRPFSTASAAGRTYRIYFDDTGVPSPWGALP